MITKSWAVDAQFADAKYKELIFSNAAIDEFLSNYDQFIVVATKGMGKTLLMRLKRDRVEAENPSIILIPHDSTSDYVHLAGSYDQGILALMRNQRFWEDLWTLAIEVSLLLNFPHKITEEEKHATFGELARAGLPSDLDGALKDSFEGRFHIQRSPSSVLQLLLAVPRSKLEKLRLAAPQVLYDLTLKHVTSGCYVFIDSFDLAIENFLPGDLAAWTAAQCGLLRAAWHISRLNRHVKVYVTIRQEAFASFKGAERINIMGSVLLLRYSKEDLRGIFQNAIAHYEGLKTVEEFVGLARIFNEHAKQNESVFDYIHRHLKDVPRWFYVLGAELSEFRKRGGLADTEDKTRMGGVRDIVNRVSADLAKDYLSSEMKLFFRGLNPDKLARELFSRANTTIFSFSNVDKLSKLLSKEYGWEHPFSLLYNLGLLGIVRRVPGGVDRTQAFKKPYEFDFSFENILPEDRGGIYLFHPALHYWIVTVNPRCRYSGVLLGDGLPWTKKHDDVLRRETVKLFISYAHLDKILVDQIVEIIQNRLEQSIWNHEIWYDKWSMGAGRLVQDEIGRGLNDSDFLILMVSPAAMESKSVEMEWKAKLYDPFCNKTHSQGRVLPIFLESMPPKDAPEFLGSIAGFSYCDSKDASGIERMVDQILHVHREL